MLKASTDPDERIVLFNMPSTTSTGTFLASHVPDYELRAHRLRTDQPITSRDLTDTHNAAQDYYGDSIDMIRSQDYVGASRTSSTP